MKVQENFQEVLWYDDIIEVPPSHGSVSDKSQCNKGETIFQGQKKRQRSKKKQKR
jgi:hypothetical protein